MHFKVLTFTTSFPLFGRLSQRKTLSQKMKKKPGVCGLSKRSTIFNDFPQNKGEIVHDNKKIAAKFHLWSNKTRSKENTLPGFIGGRNRTSSRTPAYIAAILTIGAWISKVGRPSSRAAGRSGSRWAGELPACFLLSPTNSFWVSVSAKAAGGHFSMTSFGSFNCRRFTFLPRRLGETCASVRYSDTRYPYSTLPVPV